MGRTKTGNQKKPSVPAKCGQNKRPRKVVAKPQELKKNQQTAAKLVNDSALKLKLVQKLQQSGICLDEDGLEMVTIPANSYNSNPGPSTSKDPLNVSVNSMPEADLEPDGRMTSDEESEDQLDADDDYVPDKDEGSDQEFSDEKRELPVQVEPVAIPEELPFPMPIKADLSSLQINNQAKGTGTMTGTLAHHWKEKYMKLLEQSKLLSHDLLKERAKSSRLNQLVITQMTMIRELRLGTETTVFTTEAGVDITVAQLEDISARSKRAADFAQRLALFFYGADELRKRKVTTKGDAEMTPITPKKLKFIHNKARQHVAKIEGLDAYEKIAIEANPATINKALAEKIQNLRKAHVLQEARRIVFNK